MDHKIPRFLNFSGSGLNLLVFEIFPEDLPFAIKLETQNNNFAFYINLERKERPSPESCDMTYRGNQAVVSPLLPPDLVTKRFLKFQLLVVAESKPKKKILISLSLRCTFFY